MKTKHFLRKRKNLNIYEIIIIIFNKNIYIRVLRVILVILYSNVRFPSSTKKGYCVFSYFCTCVSFVSLMQLSALTMFIIKSPLLWFVSLIQHFLANERRPFSFSAPCDIKVVWIKVWRSGRPFSTVITTSSPILKPRRVFDLANGLRTVRWPIISL